MAKSNITHTQTSNVKFRTYYVFTPIMQRKQYEMKKWMLVMQQFGYLRVDFTAANAPVVIHDQHDIFLQLVKLRAQHLNERTDWGDVGAIQHDQMVVSKTKVHAVDGKKKVTLKEGKIVIVIVKGQPGSSKLDVLWPGA